MLASRALKFTPKVALNPPHEFLLEVQGSQKLFGGLESIKSRLLHTLDNGQPYCMAVAPTALAATWLARANDMDITMPHELAGRLGRLDLGVTEWPPKTRSVLHEMGIRTIAECLRLPRDGFTRRVGKQFLLELDRALGRMPDIRPRFETAPYLSYSVECQCEIRSSQFLFPIVEKLIGRLVFDLRLRQAQIQKFELVLLHTRLPRTIEKIELVDPTNQRERFLRLAAQKCERIVLSAPVVGVVLNAAQLRAATQSQAQAFVFERMGRSRELRHSAARLIDLLRGRLGAEKVYRMRLVSDHRPEIAWRKVKDLDDVAVDPVPLHRVGRRPLWILLEATRLPGREVPVYRGQPLELVVGPERIETGWWDADVTRDYYGALTVNGERLWVYREGVKGSWYLHGVFG
jgi:protein ImuB